MVGWLSVWWFQPLSSSLSCDKVRILQPCVLVKHYKPAWAMCLPLMFFSGVLDAVAIGKWLLHYSEPFMARVFVSVPFLCWRFSAISRFLRAANVRRKRTISLVFDVLLFVVGHFVSSFSCTGYLINLVGRIVVLLHSMVLPQPMFFHGARSHWQQQVAFAVFKAFNGHGVCRCPFPFMAFHGISRL